MRHALTAAAALVVLACSALRVDAAPQPPQPTSRPSTVVTRLRGVWKAPPYRVTRSSPADREVFGPGATFVRDVNLTLLRNGRGVVTIYTSITDQHDRVIRPSAAVIEVDIEIGEPRPESTRPDQPAVRVVHAQERDRYGTRERRELRGITVSLSEVPSDPSLLNFRYDTPQTGSFGETLRRLPQ